MDKQEEFKRRQEAAELDQLREMFRIAEAKRDENQHYCNPCSGRRGYAVFHPLGRHAA